MSARSWHQLANAVLMLALLAWPLTTARATAPFPTIRLRHAFGVIVPPRSAAQVFEQCSRQTPGPGAAYWRPTRRHLVALERRLPEFVKASGQGDDFPLGRLLRQYVGVVRSGHRAIYVNLFRPTPFADPRRECVVVCDGGPSFFGVEYDVLHRVFTHIAFNGRA